jgi:hypothetical protein
VCVIHRRIHDEAGGQASVSDPAHPASYDPADRDAPFERPPTEVRGTGDGDVTLAERRRWHADPDGRPARQILETG